MIWIKRLLVLLAVLLLGITSFVAGVAVLFDESGYKRSAAWAADHFFATDLAINGALTVQFPKDRLVINIGDLQLDAHDDSYHFSSKTLHADIQLRPLLSGTLWLNDLQVNELSLKVKESTTPASDRFDPRMLPVIIARANFQDLVIEYQETPPGTLHHFSLNDLRLDDIADKGPINIQGSGSFEGESFKITGTLPPIQDVLDVDRPKPVALDITGNNGHVNIAGTIIDLMHGEGLELRLDVATPATRLLLEWLGDDIPEVGDLHASALLRGDYDAPRLEDIDATLQRAAEVTVNVHGSVDNIYSGAGMLLHIEGHSTQPNVTSWLLFGKLGQLKSLDFKGAIEEREGHIYLSGLDAAASTRKGLSVKAQGDTEFYPAGQLFLKTDSGINATFTAPTTAALNLFNVADIPELGAVSGSAKLFIRAESVGLHDTDVRIGGKGHSTARLQGKISDIPLHQDAAVTGIDLQITLQSTDVAALAAKLNYSLPAIGPGEASMTVSGNLDKLKLKQVNIRTGDNKGLLITARGNVDRVVLGKSASVDNALFDVTARSADLSKLSALAGIELPKLGQTVITSTLTLNKSNLVFNDVKVNVGRPDQPTIRLHGNITTQLHKSSSIHVDYSVAVADLVAAYADKPPGYLGRLDGTAEISDIDGSWGIEKFDLASSQTSLYQVKMQGGFDDLKNSDLIKIGVEVEVDDPAALGRALGIDLSTLKGTHGEGHLTSKEDAIVYDGKMSVGKTASTTTLHGHVHNNKPTLRGSFSIPLLDLADFGLLVEQEVDDDFLATPESSAKDYLFSRAPLPVDFLNDFDLDLKIHIDEIESYGNSSIDSVVGQVTLKDGKLKVDPLRFVYAGGTMDVIFNLQATGMPVYALKVAADDLILGPMFSQVENNTTIDGRTNVLLDLTSSGHSMHQLASALNGRINVEFENARIPKLYVDFLSVDVFGWALSNTMAGEKYVNLNCVLADFTANSGEMKSKRLVADGPNMSLGGRVDLDLRDETIDAVFLPKQKRRMFSSVHPVSLSGPIREPKVVAIPAKEAIQEIGMLALGPAIYLSTRMLEKVWFSISKGDDLGEGCADIEKLTDEAEKSKKKSLRKQAPDSGDAWWSD